MDVESIKKIVGVLLYVNLGMGLALSILIIWAIVIQILGLI